MVSRAMKLAHGQGARFASVATQIDNTPAQATYQRLGFQPHCLLIGRTLKLNGQP